MQLVKWQLFVVFVFDWCWKNKDNAEVAGSAEDAEKRKSTAPSTSLRAGRNRCATGRREPQEGGVPFAQRAQGKKPPFHVLVGFEEFAEEGGGVFAEFAVVGAEGGWEVGVDVEFADDFAVGEDGNDDFGFGFEGAGEIAGVGVYVVDDDGFAGGCRGAADALVEGDAGVGRHGAMEGAENERVASFPFEHVKADPVVAGEFFVEKGDDGFHEGFAG